MEVKELAAKGSGEQLVLFGKRLCSRLVILNGQITDVSGPSHQRGKGRYRMLNVRQDTYVVLEMVRRERVLTCFHCGKLKQQLLKIMVHFFELPGSLVSSTLLSVARLHLACEQDVRDVVEKVRIPLEFILFWFVLLLFAIGVSFRRGGIGSSDEPYFACEYSLRFVNAVVCGELAGQGV